MCFRRKHNEDYKKKLNKIDKLFIRVFFSSILLFCLIIVDSSNNNLFKLFTHSFNDNINFVKYSKLFNGVFGNFIPINNDSMVNGEVYYDIVLFEENINKISNYTFEGVNICCDGVVTKIEKNNNLYSITIKSMDDVNYTYTSLIDCEVRIYSYVKSGDIIGRSEYSDDNLCYMFNLIIEKDGVYYDFYQKG